MGTLMSSILSSLDNTIRAVLSTIIRGISLEFADINYINWSIMQGLNLVCKHSNFVETGCGRLCYQTCQVFVELLVAIT